MPARARRWGAEVTVAVEPDLSGVRHEAPESTLISVDLPAPLSPITARISPARSSKSAPSRAVTCRTLDEPRASRTGVGGAHRPPPARAGRGSPRGSRGRPVTTYLVESSTPDQRQAVAEDADDERPDERSDTRPRPPNRLVPPMTTAVMLRDSRSCPALGHRRRFAPTRAARRCRTFPPARTRPAARVGVAIPDRRAASGLLPTAYTCRPAPSG